MGEGEGGGGGLRDGGGGVGRGGLGMGAWAGGRGDKETRRQGALLNPGMNLHSETLQCNVSTQVSVIQKINSYFFSATPNFQYPNGYELSLQIFLHLTLNC